MLTWDFSFKHLHILPARRHSQPSTSPCVWATRTFGCPSRRARSVNRKSHHLLPRRFLPSNRSGKRQAFWKCQIEHPIILKRLHTPKKVRLWLKCTPSCVWFNSKYKFMSDLILIVSVNCRLFWHVTFLYCLKYSCSCYWYRHLDQTDCRVPWLLLPPRPSVSVYYYYYYFYFLHLGILRCTGVAESLLQDLDLCTTTSLISDDIEPLLA